MVAPCAAPLPGSSTSPTPRPDSKTLKPMTMRSHISNTHLIVPFYRPTHLYTHAFRPAPVPSHSSPPSTLASPVRAPAIAPLPDPRPAQLDRGGKGRVCRHASCLARMISNISGLLVCPRLSWHILCFSHLYSFASKPMSPTEQLTEPRRAAEREIKPLSPRLLLLLLLRACMRCAARCRQLAVPLLA